MYKRLDTLEPAEYERAVQAALVLGGKVGGRDGNFQVDTSIMKGDYSAYGELALHIINYDNEYGDYNKNAARNQTIATNLGAEFLTRQAGEVPEGKAAYEASPYEPEELADFANYYGRLLWQLNGQGYRATGNPNWEQMDFSQTGYADAYKQQLASMQQQFASALEKYSWAKSVVMSAPANSEFYAKFMYAYALSEPFWETPEDQKAMLKFVERYNPNREAEWQSISDRIRYLWPAASGLGAGNSRSGGGLGSDERIKNVAKVPALGEHMLAGAWERSARARARR